MPVVKVIRATEEHARELAPDLRPEDVAELEALGLNEPLEVLLHGVRDSDVAASALVDGAIAAMFGVKEIRGSLVTGPSVGQLWFLTGHAFARAPLAVTKAARRCVSSLLATYPMLVNAIDARYTSALRFAQLLGAQLLEPRSLGPAASSFIPFRIERRR